jgi:hypothetical protein
MLILQIENLETFTKLNMHIFGHFPSSIRLKTQRFGSWLCFSHHVKQYKLIIWVHWKKLTDEGKFPSICSILITYLRQKPSAKFTKLLLHSIFCCHILSWHNGTELCSSLPITELSHTNTTHETVSNWVLHAAPSFPLCSCTQIGTAAMRLSPTHINSAVTANLASN